MAETDINLSGLDVIAAIESWWGSEFDRDLVSHMIQAPRLHVVEFFSYLFSEADRNVLHPAGRSILRPMLNRSMADAKLTGDYSDYLALVAPLSLYAHEILVQTPSVFSSDFKDPSDFRELDQVLNRILSMKPLFDMGVAQFYHDRLGSKNKHPSRVLITFSEIEKSTDPAVKEAYLNLAEFMSTVDSATAQSLFFSASSGVSYMIRTAAAAPGYFNILKHGQVDSLHMDLALALSGLTRPDRGSQNLNKLMAVQVPGISAMAAQVASLRARSEEFAEWRTRLGAALVLINGIDESNDQWVSDARATLEDELSPITERLKKAVGRSPAMAALTGGMRTFSLAGVGTVASGVLGGPVAVPAAGLAAAKAIEAVATYVDARKRYRENKAVLDVLMAFQQVDP